MARTERPVDSGKEALLIDVLNARMLSSGLFATESVQVLHRRSSDAHVYVHYRGSDELSDEWIPQSELLRVRDPDSDALPSGSNNGKRKRESSTSPPPSPANSTRACSSEPSPLSDAKIATPSQDAVMTEDDFDVQDYKRITSQRNFDKVNFGQWQIKTWYFSPYPLAELDVEESGTPQGSSTPTLKGPGVGRRPPVRTSDLLAGGLTRSQLTGEMTILWVCERCFKYMAEGSVWELHAKKCDRKHPPGRKVYQRGAHTIWEVDGAKEKLYCQNLSLFGKLFIDVKTLFFDCDNFLFYILTDADSQRDHVLGFFSKEKFSYDDYNLACIIVLPPYQRKGYGMLMIEFSYELSRRTGKVGTPERPLSELGLRSYLTYWVATLIRCFRRLLTVLPPEYIQVQWSSDVSQFHSGEENMIRRKRPKGWDGEIGDVPSSGSTPRHFDEALNGLRRIETMANPDGSATSHVVVRCTLADIARATNLRVDDAAFALNECGLLSHMEVSKDSTGEQFAITREMVEAVAKERRVKEMCMSMDNSSREGMLYMDHDA